MALAVVLASYWLFKPKPTSPPPTATAQVPAMDAEAERLRLERAKLEAEERRRAAAEAAKRAAERAAALQKRRDQRDALVRLVVPGSSWKGTLRWDHKDSPGEVEVTVLEVTEDGARCQTLVTRDDNPHTEHVYTGLVPAVQQDRSFVRFGRRAQPPGTLRLTITKKSFNGMPSTIILKPDGADLVNATADVSVRWTRATPDAPADAAGWRQALAAATAVGVEYETIVEVGGNLHRGVWKIAQADDPNVVSALWTSQEDPDALFAVFEGQLAETLPEMASKTLTMRPVRVGPSGARLAYILRNGIQPVRLELRYDPAERVWRSSHSRSSVRWTLRRRDTEANAAEPAARSVDYAQQQHRLKAYCSDSRWRGVVESASGETPVELLFRSYDEKVGFVQAVLRTSTSEASFTGTLRLGGAAVFGEAIELTRTDVSRPLRSARSTFFRPHTTYSPELLLRLSADGETLHGRDKRSYEKLTLTRREPPIGANDQ